MDEPLFRMPLFLPAQGAAETEATIIEWCIAEGDHFQKGEVLAQIDSAKSVFDFEAPCDGLALRLLHMEGETVPLSQPVLEIATADPSMREWIAPAAGTPAAIVCEEASPAPPRGEPSPGAVILGVGGYLPPRVVENAELIQSFPEISSEYIYQVTGILRRHWAADDERPSGMAFKAALEAIRKSEIATKDIDAVIVATTTPDAAMPSTACILQDRLSLPNVPAFDLNAACCGWLYAVSMARGMILSGMARNVLTVGVEMQSRLLDPTDRNAYFLFGDGAGAAIISAGTTGHRIRHTMLGADTRGQHMARRGARLCHSQRQRRRPRQRRGDFRPLDSHRRPRAVPLCHREFRRHHSPRDRPDRLDAGRDPLGRSAPGQRPHSPRSRQAQRSGFPALRLERGKPRQHFQRQHPPDAHRRGRKPPAGRQADPLCGRRRHDYRGHFGGVVGGRRRAEGGRGKEGIRDQRSTSHAHRRCPVGNGGRWQGGPCPPYGCIFSARVRNFPRPLAGRSGGN